MIFQAIVCDNTIENWLQEVEKSLKKVLKGQLANVIDKFGETYWQSLNSADGDIEKTWMLENAAEIVLLVTNIDLNSSIERCLKETGREQWNSLKELSKKIKATITTTSRLLKTGDVTSIDRNSLGTRGRGSRPSTKSDIRSLHSTDGSQRPLTQETTPSHNSNAQYYPYQYQKLVNLITLLFHKRDIIRQLLGLLSAGSTVLRVVFSSEVRIFKRR